MRPRPVALRGLVLIVAGLLVVGWGVVPVPAGTRRKAAPVEDLGPDRDADGLPDAWETNGVTLDGGAGLRFIDLPAMGADPTRPDIFLQIDWMADDRHDQRPKPDALRLVVEAFARAPYRSPTGSVGIVLHVDAGPDSLRVEPGLTWGDLSRARTIRWQDNLGTVASGSYDWRAFLALKRARGGFVETGRAAVFHYAIFGHFHDRDASNGSGASGIARGIGGTDLLVTLGNFTDGVGSVQEQAGTLMHELGHNLGLRHGGCDDTNFKPGYASVMNYTFQMDGLVRGSVHGIVDYSRGVEPLLDEALDSKHLNLAPPGGGADSERACVTPGEVRAGMAVRPEVPLGDGDGPAASGCEEPAAVDDWQNVRLRVGSIGRRHAAD